ncbi:MAG: hypothetical protein IPO49_12790 [Bacteroidetes bacterium]|nr:hypothetical protein [Bacteroidota bacterium]
MMQHPKLIVAKIVENLIVGNVEMVIVVQIVVNQVVETLVERVSAENWEIYVNKHLV